MTNFDPKDHFDLESLPEWARGLVTRQYAEIEKLREEVRLAHGGCQDSAAAIGYGSEDDGAMPRVWIPSGETLLFRFGPGRRFITARLMEMAMEKGVVDRWLQLNGGSHIVVIPQTAESVALRFQIDG